MLKMVFEPNKRYPVRLLLHETEEAKLRVKLAGSGYNSLLK